MTQAEHPVIRTLNRRECEALLAGQRVGRLAFSLHDRVDIAPIGYVFDSDWIFLRTTEGHKLATLRHHPWVAFEVDDAHSLTEWQSVVVHGTFRQLSEIGTVHDKETYVRAIQQIQRISPTAFTDHDIMPERNVLCGISISEISGRSARSGDHA